MVGGNLCKWVDLVGSSAVQIKTGRCVVRSIYVVKANATDVIVLRDGTENSSTAKITLQCDNVSSLSNVNIAFNAGLRATFTGSTALIKVIYE